MQGLGDIILKVIKERGMEKGFLSSLVVLDWEKIVGEGFAKEVKAEKFENGVLILRVPDAVWAQEVQLLSAEIRKKVETYLACRGFDVEVRKVVTKVGRCKA